MQLYKIPSMRHGPTDLWRVAHLVEVSNRHAWTEAEVLSGHIAHLGLVPPQVLQETT